MKLLDKLIDYIILLSIAISYLVSLTLVIYTTVEIFTIKEPYYNRYYYAIIPLGLAIAMSIYFITIKSIEKKHD